jgi:hypothetical protein
MPFAKYFFNARDPDHLCFTFSDTDCQLHGNCYFDNLREEILGNGAGGSKHPKRPVLATGEDCPGCPEDVFLLVQECWSQKVVDRPDFEAICSRLETAHQQVSRAHPLSERKAAYSTNDSTNESYYSILDSEGQRDSEGSLGLA